MKKIVGFLGFLRCCHVVIVFISYCHDERMSTVVWGLKQIYEGMRKHFIIILLSFRPEFGGNRRVG